MNIIRFAVNRPIASSMFILMAVFLGYYFYLQVPASLLPELDIQFLFIETQYQGATSEDMANLVTEPLEGFLELIHGLKEMHSTTYEGRATFELEFRDTVDIDLAKIETYERIEAANLPVGVETFVFQFNPTEIPIIALDIFGGIDKKKVLDFTRNTLKRRIERIPGVGKAELNGERENEIRIAVAETELTRYGITLSDIWRAIIAENISPIGGRLREGRRELLVRTMGRVATAADFKMLPITRPTTSPIFLGDIATIIETFAPTQFRYRFNGQAAVMLEISRKPSANTLELCREIKNTIQQAEAEENSKIQTDIYMDASEMIEKVLSGIRSDLYIGLIVATIVLICFLVNIRSSLIVLTTVPVCIMATFVPMFLFDINLNLLSLMGFALVSGMLIDNAIIIIENVFRFLRKGHSARKASLEGPMEVTGAVMASTFTSMAVFIPIFFIGGQEMRLFRDLAFTAIFALGSSLLVAFILVPLLTSRLLGSSDTIEKQENIWISRFVKISGLSWISGKALNMFLFTSQWSQRRWWKRLFLVCIVILFLIIGYAIKPAKDTAQMGNPNDFLIRVNTGGGTSALQSDGFIRDIEKYLRQEFTRVEDISSWSHKGGGGLYVELWDKFEFNKRYPDNTFITIEKMKEQIVKDYQYMPELTLRLDNRNPAAPEEKSFEIRILGRHFDKLPELAEKTRKQLLSLDEIYQVETAFDLPGEEVRILIDHEKASDFHISPQQVATLVRQSLSGGIAFGIPREGDKIDVRVTRPGSEPLDTRSIGNLHIPLSVNKNIELYQIAQIETVRTTPPLEREKGEFSTTLKMMYRSEIGAEELQQKLMNDSKTGILDRNVLPMGYRYAWGGVIRQMMDQDSDMLIFAITAIGLVFLIMASLFESFLQPLIVMFTLPLAYFGAVLGVRMVGMHMNEMAIFGTIILLGIVVNDAIVLVDYINLLRRRGCDRHEAIYLAVKIRIRPIFMTTLTTVGALLPLLFGMEEGAEFRKPMAAVVASGLMFATILTLLFIPAVYSLVEDIRDVIGFSKLRILISTKNIFNSIKIKN